MTLKITKTKKPPLMTADAWAKSMQRVLDSWIYPHLCNVKPLSKAQLAKLEKERIEYERKEQRRRAKKITMTVGELEDKLEDARNQYDD